MGAAKQEFEDEVLTLISGPNLVVAVWRNAPRIEHVAPMREVQSRLHRRLGGMYFVFVNVILSGTPSFDEQVRKELADLVNEFGRYSLGQANLVLLEGLAGTATRAFLSTMNLLGRHRAPAKVFKDRDAMEQWVLERLLAHDPKSSRLQIDEALDLANVSTHRATRRT